MPDRRPAHPVVDIPEPFATAFSERRCSDVVDAEVPTPEARFARGLARRLVGRREDSSEDFLAAAELGDVSRLELIRNRIGALTSLKADLDEVRAICGRCGDDEALAAVAAHVRGHILGKLRRTPRAVSELLRASDAFERLGLHLDRAQVHDTLGQVYAAAGEVGPALTWYGLSLVDKVTGGDRYGMAVTLGNLGRVHLRCGRLAEAARCFSADLGVVEELGDDFARPRVLEDLGRTLHALGRPEEAREKLELARELARRQNATTTRFFCALDLARLAIEDRDHDAARSLMAEADDLVTGSEPVLAAHLEHVRGLAMRRLDPKQAAERLARARDGFAEGCLPDLEIETSIALARCLVAIDDRAQAEQVLQRALRVARADALSRWQPAIREVLGELALHSSLDTNERGRLTLSRGAPPSPDGYTLLERLGRGAFGEVWRGFDPRTGRVVAIKVLHLEKLMAAADAQRTLESARRELFAASRVRHPGVVRVHAFGFDANDRPYVVQDFVPGFPLKRLIPSGPYSRTATVMRSLWSLADALDTLHEAGVIHRDIKPDNIMMHGESGPATFVDFGLAHLTDVDGHREELAGTIPYMSPEQACGRPLDGSSDVFSIGVVAYEWLTGRRPLPPAETRAELLRMVATRARSSVREARPTLAASVVALIDGMLEMDPVRRLTARQVRDRVEAILETPEDLRDAPGEDGGAKAGEFFHFDSTTDLLD